jgi:CHAD domain-containing protein
LSKCGIVFAAASIEPFKSGFRKVAALTGPVRDLDVLSTELTAFAGSTREDAAGLEAIAEALHTKRRGHHAELADALSSSWYRQLIAGWQDFLIDPETSTTAEEPTDQLSRSAIWSAYRRVRRHADTHVGDGVNASEAAIHRLRIACKKMRYTMEAFSSLYDQAAIERLLATLRAVQDHVGRYRDCNLHSELLLEFGSKALDENGGGLESAASVQAFRSSLFREAEIARSDFAANLSSLTGEGYKRALADLTGESAFESPDTSG